MEFLRRILVSTQTALHSLKKSLSLLISYYVSLCVSARVCAVCVCAFVLWVHVFKASVCSYLYILYVITVSPCGHLC